MGEVHERQSELIPWFLSGSRSTPYPPAALLSNRGCCHLTGTVPLLIAEVGPDIEFSVILAQWLVAKQNLDTVNRSFVDQSHT